MQQGRRSLADILTRPVRLSPEAAVAIVRELCRVPADTLMPVDPEAAWVAPEHVWLYSDGKVRLSPGLVPVIGDLGALLELLLLLGRRQDEVSVGP